MISIYRGDTHSLSIQVTDNAQPFNLTGFIAKLSIKSSENAFDYLLEKAIDNIENPELGIITIDLTENETKTLPAGKHVYDVEIRNGDSTKVHTVIKSNFNVQLDITR